MAPERDARRVVRPTPSVVDAVVPDESLIRPPPNRFTHELTADESYRFDAGAAEPAGVLAAGTPVVLLVEEDDGCRVVDGRGLYVRVPRASLRPRR